MRNFIFTGLSELKKRVIIDRITSNANANKHHLSVKTSADLTYGEVIGNTRVIFFTNELQGRDISWGCRLNSNCVVSVGDWEALY